MKKLLIFTALFFLGASAFADSVLYETNFDSMELGPIFENYSDSWYKYYGSVNEDNYMNVVEGGCGGTGRSLRYHSSGYTMATRTRIPNNENHSLTKDFRVTFMVNFTKVDKISFNSNEGAGELLFLKSGEDKFYIEGGDFSFSTTNSCPVGEWVTVSYTLNLTPGNRKLLYLKFGNVAYEDLNVPINSDVEEDAFPNFLFFQWAESEVSIDDLKIELLDRSVGDVQLALTGNNRISLGSNSAAIRLINEGKEPGEITITSDSAFVKINGQESFVKTLVGGASTTLNITVDRSEMGNDYYMANIKCSCGSIEASYPLFIQSGVEGEGYTYYRSHFNEFETGKDIRAVDPAWKNGYGSPDNSPIVEMDGEKALQINYKSYNAFHVKCDTKAGTCDSYNYRVSFKGYVPSGGEKYNQYNLGSTATVSGSEVINQELPMVYNEGRGGVTFTHMGNVCPLDEWFDVSYVFNYQPDNCRLISITFGDVVSNLNYLLPNASGNHDYFNWFRFFGWCEANSAPIFVKDLVIDSVARPDVGPELEVSKGGQIFLDESVSSLTVLNSGTGNLPFRAEVTRGGGWLSIREADEETGILEDTIVGSGSKKYTLDIVRADLGNSYGFGQVTVTGAGDTKVVNYFVQSGDETGATLYFNDFDSMELGNIKNSDPAWTGGAEGRVVVDSDGSCLEVVGSDQQLHAIVKAKEGSSANYNYVVRMKLKFPVGATGPFFITGTDLSHPQGEYGLVVNNDSVGVDTRNCSNNPLAGVTVPAGEWFELAYTYNGDPLNKRLLNLTLGENTIECSEPINIGDKYDFFNEFRFYVFSNGEHQPFYVDDLYIGLEPKDASKPGVMDIKCLTNPIPYTESGTTINILNAGGRAFTYTAVVQQGGEWLTLSSYAGTVGSSDSLTVSIDRSKLGYGFHRAVVKFTSSEGETKKLTIGVQSGSAEEGYVLYASDINSLKLSEVGEEEVTNELSEQDACWDRVTLHNRAAVSLDPKGSNEKCIRMINANDWSKYSGYLLNVNAPAEAASDYDIIVGMKMLIPDTYVNLPEEEYEHPYAAFFVSQDNEHRQNELYFYLDQEGGTLNVFPELSDIQNTNWWQENAESSAPVPNNEWFAYYTRFSTKLVDYQYKRFYAFTFGGNEYHLEGSDQIIDYPNGISEKALANEAMPTIKFWSYRDNANILMKDITVALVPHDAIPEPALFGLLALIGLLLKRR
ncbi:hypothetical protein IKW72_08690 [bacterium]|nr:hypothetical protein [bacterium]